MTARNALGGSLPRATAVLAAVLVVGLLAGLFVVRAGAQQPTDGAARSTTDRPGSSRGGASTSSETGRLAWYGKRFAGPRTASGQRFNPGALTKAHRTLPFGTKVKVNNVANSRSVVVRVNDRGPTRPDRIGDVSQAAALGAARWLTTAPILAYCTALI